MFTFMLDSGAFSVWTKGISIDIDRYIECYFRNEKYISYIVNLDVIPGRFGTKPSYEERKECAKKGYENYLYMLSKGVPKEKLIHVFHQHEDFSWLVKYAKNIPYIGISPANDVTKEERKIWLDNCMKYVCDIEGAPIVKFHGFGLTSVDLIVRYPWYSVDSVTAVKSGGMGNIYIPQYSTELDDFIFTSTPRIVNVSSRSMQNSFGLSYRLEKNDNFLLNKYLDRLGIKFGISEWDGEKEVIVEEGVSNVARQRMLVNLLFYNELRKRIPEWPYHKFDFKKSVYNERRIGLYEDLFGVWNSSSKDL